MRYLLWQLGTFEWHAARNDHDPALSFQICKHVQQGSFDELHNGREMLLPHLSRIITRLGRQYGLRSKSDVVLNAIQIEQMLALICSVVHDVQLALSLVLVPPLVALFTLLLQKAGRWLVPSAVGFMLVLQLVAMLIYPRIAALFNKFEPLPSNDLRSGQLFRFSSSC